MPDYVLVVTFIVEADADHANKVQQIIADGAAVQGYTSELVTVLDIPVTFGARLVKT